MRSLRALLGLSAAFAVTGAAGATAADLYGGGIKDAPYYAEPAPQPAGWYFRLDGGYSTYDEPQIVVENLYELYDTSVEDTWSLGGGVGVYLPYGFRADVTYDHRFEAKVSGRGRLLPHLHDAYGEFGLESDLFLANVYYDFNRGGKFNPYVGAGLGFVQHSTTGGIIEDGCACVGTIDPFDKTSAAAAVMAGVTIDLFGGRQVVGGSTKDGPVYETAPSKLLIDLGYRFLYLGEAETGPTHGGNGGYDDPTVDLLHAHEVRLGLRYNVN